MEDLAARRPALLVPVVGVGIFSISSAAILIRWCDDAAPVVIAAARLGIATLVLTPGVFFVRGRGRLFGVPASGRRWLLLGGLFLGAHFVFWISSLRLTSVLSSVVIVTTNPIFVGIGSLLFFKERIGRQLVGGIALAIVGGVLITLSDSQAQPGSIKGNLLSLAGAVMGSGYLLVGRRVRRDVDLLTYMIWVYGVAALMVILLALGRGEDFGGFRPQTYLYLVLLAVVPQVIGHGALNYALKHLSATLVAVCILGEPIGASVLAFLLLNETPGAWQLAGGALILAGIFLSARSQT